MTTNPTVYVETTVISYLTAWPSRDIVRAAHQQITREWWENQREQFELVASALVLQEAGAGDATAAGERLRLLSGIRLLDIPEAATGLAEHLVTRGALPSKAVVDALHIGICAAHGIDYLMTWNCRHLANAAMWHTIEQACVERGSGLRSSAHRKPWAEVQVMNDEIVDEVRRVRDEYAARFGYDIRKIVEDLRRRQQESGRTFENLPPKKPTAPRPFNKAG